MSKKELDPNQILMREFDYIEKTLSQQDEDRVKVFLYYISAAGAILGSFKLVQTNDPRTLVVAVMVLGAFSILGFLLFLKMIRLRMMWYDCILAFVKIKRYYVDELKDQRLAEAFHWYPGTNGAGRIPAAGSKSSVAFIVALAIAIVSSISGGAIALLLGCAQEGAICDIVLYRTVLIGITIFVIHIAAWHFFCDEKIELGEIQQPEDQAGH